MSETAITAAELTRRRILQGAGIGLAAVAGLTGLAGVGRTGIATAADHHHRPAEGFDEVYRGRRIQGGPSAEHHHHGGWTVRIDGQELHVMQNADGSWISVVNHYQPHGSPRALARAAVLDLQGAALLPID